MAKLVTPVLLAAVLLLLLGSVLTPEAATVPSVSPLVPWASPIVRPTRNASAAPVTTMVSVTYDGHNITSTTVSTCTFAVHAMQTGLLTQTYGVNGGTINLMPTRSFKPGELVQVSATTGTLNLGGQGPNTPTVWQFWAAATGGSGIFTDSGQTLGNSYSRAVALGDVDSDGALDALVANTNQANRVWRNDGAGTFDILQTLSSSSAYGVALGDLDGDGDLDAFFANTDQPNQVWWNNGLGNFADSGQRLGSSEDSWAVALGDMDGDSDLDAFVANSNQANQVWWNNGHGVFTEVQILGDSDSRAVALGDLDGDDDLDAFVANGQENKVWLNRGDGRFYDSGQELGQLHSQAVALGDVDGDLDLDAFVVNIMAEENRVWLNNGKGVFSCTQSLDDPDSQAVALGDVDRDGDLDAYIANKDKNRVWLNDGSGHFRDSGQRLGSSVSNDVKLGNLNGYGALDAFVANSGSDKANKVWLQVLHPAVSMNKTVGPDAGLCADGDSIGISTGTQVIYCYAVMNIGDVALTTHTLTDTELGVILSDNHHNLAPGATWFITRAATLMETTVNSAAWTASVGEHVAVATDTATVGVIAPTVRINHIIPNPSWFLESVEFEGSGITDTITEFIDEYEWTRIPEFATCGSYPTPVLLGTAARIQDNTLPVGEHRICLRGGVYSNTTSSGHHTMVWSQYDTMTVAVRPDRWAYSDIAVGPKSVSFWADRSAKENPVYHPDVGDTVYVKIDVYNISVKDTPPDADVGVFFYDGPITNDGPITASLYMPVTGTLVGTDTIDFIKAGASEFVTIPWTIGGEVGYRPFAVDIGYTENISYFINNPLPPYKEPHFESDYKNNRTTGAIPVGHITGTYGISVTAGVVPIRQSRLYAGYPAYVFGEANYAWDVLLATMGATTTIEIGGLSGGGAPYREIYQTWTTSPFGHYGTTIRLPYEPGVYTATVIVDDGNLVGARGTQVITFIVLEPPEPLPDLYVERFSVLLSGRNTYVRDWKNYTFHRVYDQSMLFGVQNNPITITARVRNGGNLSVTDPFAVSFYDGPPDDGGAFIGSEIVDGLARGTRKEVRYIWTPTRTGVYSIQVVVDEVDVVTEANEVNNYDSYYYEYQLCYNGIVGSCYHAAHRDVIDVRAANPDLRARSPRDSELKPYEPAFGEPFTMPVEIHNIGHSDVMITDAFTFTVYDGYPNIGLASTRVVTSLKESGPQRVYGPMNRGTYRTFDVVWDTGYAGTVPGLHHICVEVDTGAEIDEELEENNVNCWDVYAFPANADLYPYRLTYSNNSPLPEEYVEITAWFENRGAASFTGQADVSFYHTSITSTNLISTTGIVEPIPGHRGTGATTVTWKTLDSHGTTYIYVLYIKESGYNHGPRSHAQRLNIRKRPSPNLRVLSRDIQVDPRSPVSGEDVHVSADIANVSRSPVATATNFIVEFHTSGPTAGYHELGQLQTIPSLGPGMVTTIQAGETFTMADEFYAVQVSAWPGVEQGDENYGDNEATTSILQADADMLVFTKTVGIVEGVCGDTDVITVMAGAPVYYCYQMTNRGDVRLGAHDLFDDQLGDVLSGYTYDLLPGETFSRTELAVFKGTTHGTATWTASTDPYAFTAADVTVVNVRNLIYLPLVLRGSQN